MKLQIFRLVLLILALLGSIPARADSILDPEDPTGSAPLVLGRGEGLFQVGSLLFREDFEDLDPWVVQVQEKSGFPEARIRTRDGVLDCLVPGRGATIWFRRSLGTRVTITYDVLCPTPDPAIPGVQPRDINNFWMATDPTDPDRGLFDSDRYTGAFKTYDKMHGYYASTGGGGKVANRTTRMRRYPREADGQPASHLALDHRDEQPGYLITPDRWMRVQLVAYEDLIQYIVDGQLVYEIARGDRVEVEDRDQVGRKVKREAVYDLERFPAYRRGHFGFRMVGTHHLYRNFRVHALEPADGGRSISGRARTTVHVSSLNQLREAVKESDRQIILEPGEYVVSDREGFRFSGSNNEVILEGTSIRVPLEIVSGRDLIRLTGNDITLRGGFIEDVYPDGSTEVTDFGAYNRGQKFGKMNEIEVPGDDNRIIGLRMIIRGSYPYGYGNMYGIGRGNVVGLRKHCGIQITGDRAIIDGCNIRMEAFGHVIFVQGGDRTTVRNTVVEGTVRPSNDCYEEKHPEDLARRFNYQLQWPEDVRGLPIPRDHMINCTEDGIRAYKGAGDMIVENCVVKKTRGGIKLYMARSARVSGCQVLDCVIQGYSLPSHGVIERSSGNAAYGPLLYVHFDGHSNQTIDLEVLPAPHSLGDHPLAAIKGRNHSIRFTRGDRPGKEVPRPIIIGYPMRFDFLCVNYPDVPEGHGEHFARHSPKTYRATGITLVNETEHPVVLGKLARDNTVTSRGPVRDPGKGNEVRGE